MEKARYILFSFTDYYPCGGMGDAQFSFNTKEEAEKTISELKFGLSSEVEILDTETFKVAEGFNFEDAWNEMQEVRE